MTTPIATPSRRAFLAGSAVLASALVVPLHRALSSVPAGQLAANGYLAVLPDGAVSLALPKTEMGQGIMTALTMLVAEELGLAPSAVKVSIPPADRARFAPIDTTTGGSTSIRELWKPLRQAAANARAALVDAAARQWKVMPDGLTLADGAVVNPASGKRLGFAALVADAAAHVPTDATPTPRSAWKVIGKDTRRLDSADKVRGTAQFGIDVKVPGMKIATLAQSPVFGGKLASHNAAAAKAVPGVADVIALDDCLFVTADSLWTAKKGLEAAAPTWNEGANAGLDQAQVVAALDAAVAKPGVTAKAEGDLAQARAGAAKTVEALYHQPFLAHATMEPGNCTAHVTPQGVQVWTGTQVPSDCRAAAARVLGLGEDKVQVHNFLMGGGFGRRLETDMVERTVSLAAKVPYPVKLVWTREEDIQHDMVRPAYADRISASLDQAGKVAAWEHRIAGSAVMARFLGDKFNGVDDDAVDGAIAPLYPAKARLVTFKQVESAMPTGWWRGVGGLRNTFVIESFADELALAAGQDPLAWRLAQITDPRARAVLQKAAAEAGWGKALPKGEGLGLAVLHIWDTCLAAVAHVKVDAQKQILVPQVTVAVDCGPAINPLGVKAQIEGGVTFALSAALYGGVTLEKGRIAQSNYNDVRPLRMNEAPRVITHVMPTDNAPGGMGEPPAAVIAPAVANALFAATGKRVRQVPLQAGFEAA
ncbi:MULTISPECIES: molybdopterin cofactor-binding domain-containing protein [unclassified Novosphingobium]|uniref:xanthine dehydrogenase family protein molybdopterin-binding subunit n=1 Tax=unclassified Novosphingobium TaxID=2644732 RepID=UPI000D4C45DE|nr:MULTISPECIES: molybdopterin cofactor-binding domain-containing protein [unclassified Novosphingobium]PTR10372.1 isoquinoline 1-oxidoreductase beta subunit [Novosphingobium sp. GV055]PUB03043.1 isoquinoline 1-oxidoreductase beta subunit [Novosphingobium sp. GV061]PUB19704.1 isoquinoline 1-oxidoreductase beta subunit [Novosphingobium sp. GV079]PUB41343.1 isoquinoline 1-oxidoreductase beta subunit [Novosphingobium sp. GV027]